MRQLASPKVSIAMATYNGDKYLREQLESFIAQTRLPDELIITDDCSTDETETIVQEFARSAPFNVEFYRNEKNLGYCGNFNAALIKTTGDWVFLSDQDDVWFPQKIEHMLGVAERYSTALVVMNDAKLTDGKLNEVGLTKVGQIRSAGFTEEDFVMGCCAGIKRELLDMCLPIPEGFKAHDNWVVGFADGLKAKVVDETPLQYYRRHETNESQFIANRLTKVTQRHALINKIQSLFYTDSMEQMTAHHEQLELLLQGIQKAQGAVADKSQPALVQFAQVTQARLALLERRIDIRQKKFILRCMAAIRLFVDGGYREANGMKSMVRDILN